MSKAGRMSHGSSGNGKGSDSGVAPQKAAPANTRTPAREPAETPESDPTVAVQRPLDMAPSKTVTAGQGHDPSLKLLIVRGDPKLLVERPSPKAK
jgi:hypothetical protein